MMNEGSLRAFPLCVGIALFAAWPAAAADFVVTWANGRASRTAHALGEAMEIVAKQRVTAPRDDITVRLPAGEIRLEEPIVVDTTLAGEGRLTLQGARDGVTRVLGSVAIDPAKIRRATIADFAGQRPHSAEVLNAALRVDLSTLGARPATALRVASKQSNLGLSAPFVQGGQRLALARWPVTGWQVGRKPAAADPGLAQTRGIPIVLDREVYDRLSSEPDLWVSGFFGFDWFYERASVSGRDPAQTTLVVGPVAQRYELHDNYRFAVENAYSDLTRPGQYVLTRDGRSALVLPFAGGKPLEFVSARSLLVIGGAANVTVSDIAFAGTVDTPVRVHNSRSVTLRDLFVGNSGGDGIEVSGGSDVTIERVVVADSADTGIVVEAGDRRRLQPGNVRIVDSVVTRAGALAPAGRPGIRLSGVGNVVAGCLLSDFPHTALSIDGNDHLIERNEIEWAIRETDDAGAIYMGRDWTARGNVLRGNYLHDIGRANRRDKVLTAVYLDDGESGFRIEGNVFHDVSRGVFIHGGRDNEIVGNAFLSSTYPAIWLGRATSLTSNAQWGARGAMRRRVEEMPIDSDPWRRKYPAIADVLTDDRETPRNNTLVSNVIFGEPAITNRDKRDLDLLTAEHSRVFPAEPGFAGGGAAVVRRALAEDPRLKPLGLVLADRHTALARVRFLSEARLGAGRAP